MKTLRGALIGDPGIILSTMFFGIISIVVSLFDRTGVVMLRLARMWGGSLLAICGVKVQRQGLELIDPNGSYVFVANHVSYMDTPVMLAHIPVQFRFLAKTGLFKIPFLGQHLTSAGHIPVPREDARAAVRVIHQAAETIQKKNISLLIFPEGGRSHDGNLAAFKEGAAAIAIKAGVPLVPVILLGTRKILPYGGSIVKAGAVTLCILPPIATKNMTLKDRGRLTDQVRELMAGHLSSEPASMPVIAGIVD